MQWIHHKYYQEQQSHQSQRLGHILVAPSHDRNLCCPSSQPPPKSQNKKGENVYIELTLTIYIYDAFRNKYLNFKNINFTVESYINHSQELCRVQVELSGFCSNYFRIFHLITKYVMSR